MLPNRFVAYATAALGLVAALSPVVAGLDWESTAGVIAGAGIVAAAALTWLNGWQKYEERTALEDLAPQNVDGEGIGVEEVPLEPGPIGIKS